jgi:hypothetical protein
MTDDSMKRLSEMATTLKDVKAKIAGLTEEMKKQTAIESALETEDIPELMKELEMKNFTLTDGTKIEVIDDLKCGITHENRDAAHGWLRKNKFGGIIKTLVSQQYGPGELEEAKEAAEALKVMSGREAMLIENIHANTLKAFLKEQRAKGTKIPAKLFGLFPFSKAKVTPPKE